ncbi:MAG: hypothetical protein Q7S22_00185 [Candidatus Micrarchaeota archaeon]|nr:hypothetical protein [Candidatus Micrarchaeota archaeon]
MRSIRIKKTEVTSNRTASLRFREEVEPIARVERTEIKMSKRQKIREIIDARIERGETLEEIKTTAKLNETEIKIVDTYIMQDEPMKLSEVAERIRRKYVTVNLCLVRIENKLLGRDPLYHLKRKYYNMSKEQLRSAVRETGAKNRNELGNCNTILCRVALERGVLDSVLPSRLPDRQAELRESIAKTSDIKRKKILEILEPLECEVLHAVKANDEEKIKSTKEKHGIGDSEFKRIVQKLIKIINDNHRISQTRKLRATIRKLGIKKISEIGRELTNDELLVLDKLGLTDKPERMVIVAGILGKTREGARQVESRLLKKLEEVAKHA